jgi:WD40 repeat protein
MPDTHEDIRRRLFDAAWETPAYAPAPERTLSRARRRAATTIVGGTVAVILAVVVAASSFPLPPKGRTAVDPRELGDREFLVDISSGRVTEISERSIMEGASWISASPDGKQVAFTKEARGSQEVFVANLDGTAVRQVSRGFADAGEPKWSPSGDEIAYWALDRTEVRNIHVTDLATGRTRTLTRESHDVWSLEWSPNGRSILYTATVPFDPDVEVSSSRAPRDTSCEPSTFGLGRPRRWWAARRCWRTTAHGRPTGSCSCAVEA